MSIKNLLNKSKGLSNESTKPIIKPIIKKSIITPAVKPVSKPPKFKLGIGMAKPKPVPTDEKLQNTIQPKIGNDSPIKQLSSVLQNNPVLSENSITSILGDMSVAITETAETGNAEAQEDTPLQKQTGNSSPTLSDLSKFVFAEQPDESTEEIALKFSGMLDGLSTALGSDIPQVLSDTLKFMKEHAFLAEILKPEEIGTLVKTMAKSYGYVVNNQAQKSTKRKVKVKEQNDILNSLDILSF